MTLIENDSPKVQYTGPFIKGQLLPLTFPYIATEDVKMIIDDTPAIFNVDYEIITEPNDEHPVAYPNSAYIKSDLPNAKQITLYRVTPLDQQAPFPQISKFRSERVEQALDKLTMQQQEQEEQLSRCIIAPITLETFNGQLPAPASDQALKWNTEGTALENYDIIGEQEAFETEVNTKFKEQSISIENRIGQFEEETNTQFSEFRNEINENLEAVLNAADKLETLEQQVQAATDAANTALTSATKADEYAEEAFMSADQAEDALEEIKQVIQDAEDTIGELVQNCGLPMFSPIWSDHFYNDASFLRADAFSWHYADMYVTAYEEILKQYNNPEATEQTDGDIIYKLSPDGFRIALASEHDKVLERYLDGEKAWFYILDTENQCFKLPREKKTDGKYLYFYVGTYERPETEVNLGTVTDALNNKVDLDGGNYAGSGLEAMVKKSGGSELNNPCSFGDSKYSPVALNNLSWLKSEGQWNSKAVYPAYYDWALTNFNNGVEGFALATGEYTDYDVVINPADETFRLPLLDGSESLLSDKYDNLTLGASGDTYTAPANGWLTFGTSQANQNGFIRAYNENNILCEQDVCNFTGSALDISIPCKKGHSVLVTYHNAGILSYFRFVYAQGNGSLYYYVGETVQNANLINAGRIEEKLVDKVDTNASNLTAEGKSLISGWSMPSDKYIDLTLGASGTDYTAPANGWFFINKQNSGNQYVIFKNTTQGYGCITAPSGNSGVYTIFPVQKGDVIKVEYTASGTTHTFRFIYAEGEK